MKKLWWTVAIANLILFFVIAASFVYPDFGLYYFSNADPTIAPGVVGNNNQLMVRTDTPSLYYKSSAANTGWTKIGISGITGGTCPSGQVVTAVSASGALTCGIAPAFAAYDAWFGTGGDGDVTFDGTSVVAGITPAAIGVGIYPWFGCLTYTLTKDIALDDATLNNNVCIRPNGWRIMVKGTLTCGGTGSRIGANANSASSASAVTGPSSNTVGGGAGGAAGGTSPNTGSSAAGSVNSPVGFWNACSGAAPGTTGGGVNPTPGGNGQCQGAGGGGGGTTCNPGGSGGAISVLAVTNGAPNDYDLTRGRTLSGNVWVFGSGGGGGSGCGGTSGGAGGAGGAELVIMANAIDGPCSFEALGGNGFGAVSGGGGGGGGHAEVVYCTKTGASATVDVSGGTGGAGNAAGGNGTGGSYRIVNVCGRTTASAIGTTNRVLSTTF